MVRTKLMLRLWLAFVKYLYSTCCTKFVLRFQLALIKCTGMVRTKLMLRLWLAFVKCSTQKKPMVSAILITEVISLLSGSGFPRENFIPFISRNEQPA